MDDFPIADVHLHCNSDDENERSVLMRELNRNNVAAAVVSSIGAEHNPRPGAAVVRDCNKAAAAFAEKSPRRLRWLAYLNPQLPGWPAELARCLREGAAGIKLWISVKDERGSMDRTSELLDRAGREGLPVVLHTYNRARKQERTGGEITVEEFGDLALRSPDTVMIAAHAGGGGWRRSMGVLRDRLPNALVDVSGSFPELGMVEALAAEVGTERVLFGSDAPGRGMPSQLAKVVLADLPDEDKQSVLWKNAARVFSLGEIGPVNYSAELIDRGELPDFGEDHFIFCGRWPFFRTESAAPAGLDAVLSLHGIRKGYAADLGALFALDLEAANRAFLKACGGCERVRPLAVLDPRAHNWPTLLRLLPDGFEGALVSPYIHNWKLDDPAHDGFFRQCARKGLDLWVNCGLADHRFIHPGFAPRPVSVEELSRFTGKAPGISCVFQGLNRAVVASWLDRAGGGNGKFRFEISRLTDGTGTLAGILGRHGRGALVMGREYPFRHPDSVPYSAERA